MKICRRILCRSGNESWVEMLGIWTNRVTVQILSGKRKRVGRRVRAVKMKQPWTGIHSMQRAPQDGTKAVFSWHYFIWEVIFAPSVSLYKWQTVIGENLLLLEIFVHVQVLRCATVVQCDGPCCGQARASAWKPIVTDRLTSLQKQVLIMGFLWMVPGAHGWAASEGPSWSE